MVVKDDGCIVSYITYDAPVSDNRGPDIALNLNDIPTYLDVTGLANMSPNLANQQAQFLRSQTAVYQFKTKHL